MDCADVNENLCNLFDLREDFILSLAENLRFSCVLKVSIMN